MNVSLPFASPARKQDTTNNNKKGQPHDNRFKCKLCQWKLGVTDFLHNHRVME
jgi:hypothetical protein